MGRRAPRHRPARRTALFTTRRGGVSEGPYASLNLGVQTDDDPDAVAANRERARGDRAGARPWPPCTGPRHHASTRRPRGGCAEADGQVTDEPGLAPLVLVADCLPVALVSAEARRDGPRAAGAACRRRPRGGRRALRELGGDGRGRGDRARRRRAAATRSATRSARRSATAPRAARSTSRPIAAEQLDAAGVERGRTTPASARCAATRAVLLPPPRRGRHRTAGGDRMAELIPGWTPSASARNLERGRARSRAGREPDGVEILAAAKYVALEELGVLAAGGITLVGENRAQELEAKAARIRRLHLGLHRPAAEPQGQAVLPHVRYIHSSRSDSALAQLAAPRRRRETRDPRRGQRRRRGGQGGRRARRAAAPSSTRCAGRRWSGLMTMPPLAPTPEDSRPLVRRAARAGRRARPARSSRWAPRRTTRSPRRRGRRSCAWARGSTGRTP